MSTVLGIAKALYDYASQQPNASEDDRELSIEENEMLYVIERGDDGWWKVKKKAEGEEEEGEEGLVPANYVAEASPLYHATAMYDYDRQTSEEVSFQEGARVDVYDKEDPDWFLVGVEGQYGFAPSNYLEEGGKASQSPAVIAQQGPSGAMRPESVIALPPPAPPLPPAATTVHLAPAPTLFVPPTRAQPDFSDHTALESDGDDAPPPPRRPVLPTRVSSQSQPAMAPRPKSQAPSNDYHTQNVEPSQSQDFTTEQRVSTYRTWLVHEVESKKKKKKGTLGLGNNEISWAPDKSSESIQTWSITCLLRYATEKKHVFIDLQGPPKAASFDFHAGSSDAAQEINTILAELAGAARAPGIREIAGALNAPLPALPQNSGLARMERETGFPERHDSDEDKPQYAGAELLNGDEKYATVMYDFEAQGEDEITVRAGARVVVLDDRASRDWWKIRAGHKEGVIPSDYLEVAAPKKAAKKKSSHRDSATGGTQHRDRSSSRPRAQELKPQATGGKSKPDASKVRSWTDRSKSFKVDAQLLGCSDGKIHLHKSNGVKISVPIAKMSLEDVEYVEHKIGRSLREGSAPLDAEQIAKKAAEDKEARRREAAKASAASKPQSDFDWFDFFLSCGCDPNICQRYTAAFEREGFSEEDITSLEPGILRNLGLKEGDILKVGRAVDTKLGRQKPKPASFGDVSQRDDNDTGASGLLTGPGGELKNNTRRGRPERSAPANDTVDARALQSSVSDDPWAVRKIEEQPPAKPVRPQSTGAPPSRVMEDLSLLDTPLIPIPAQQTPAQAYSVPPAPMQQSAAPETRSQPPAQVQQYPSQQFLQSIQQMQPQKTASIPAVPAFMPQTSFGSAIVAHKTGGGDISNFVPPPLYPHQTGYQQQQMTMMQNMPAAQYQDPFKTGSAAPYQDPFKTGFAQVQPTGFLPQQTGFMPQQTGFMPQQTGFIPQQTGFSSAPVMPMQATSFSQPQQSGYAMPQQNVFPPQQTGFPQAQPQFGFMQPQQPAFGGMQSQQTGFNPAQPLNSALPAFGGQIGPQQTGFGYQQPQQTGFGMPQQSGFGGFNAFGGMPQQPQPQMSAGMLKMQQMMAEAQAQQGAANQNGFGGQQQQQQQGGFQPVQFGRAASAGPTGRKANLNNASAGNPFGF